MAGETGTSRCCAPVVSGVRRATSEALVTAAEGSVVQTGEEGIVPGGKFVMGDQHDEGYPADGELPLHAVELCSFFMDVTAVTVEAFSRFVDSTGYVTDAEDLGISAVFHEDVTAPQRDVLHRLETTPWWVAVRGASWRHPQGAGSEPEPQHPVVHISWRDASAFATWAGKRLPTEAEWEYAARGGLTGARFPWGNELRPDGMWKCNVFQGDFPRRLDQRDGVATTVPAKSFEPNGFGLWNMVGNVWEWCNDWFSPTYYQSGHRLNPRGPSSGHFKVFRGGSFLCHRSYCYRYRVAARSANAPDSTSANVGFRCARDISAESREYKGGQ